MIYYFPYARFLIGCAFILTSFFTALSPVHGQSESEGPELTNFSDAHTSLLAVAAPYIGKIRIDHLTIGAQGGFGILRPDGQSAEDGGSLNAENVGSGIAHASYFAGINIGGLFNWFGVVKNLTGIPSPGSLHNFDILFAYSDIGNILSVFDDLVKIGYKTFYAGVRWQFIPGAALPLTGDWKGIVLGTGYLTSTANIGAAKGTGIGEYILESKVNTIPLEVNTGLEVFFINFTLGAGALLVFGHEITTRSSISLSDILPGETPENTMKIPKANQALFYLKGGIEIPIIPYAFRLGAEVATVTNGGSSYAFSLRLSI